MFILNLCEAVRATGTHDAAIRRDVGRTIADTAAVAAAGFAEPVARLSLRAYAGYGPPCWNGATTESREAAVLINGIAAHALDFDDVYLDSGSHSSAVIVPSVLALNPDMDADRLLDACAAGLVAARAVGTLLGRRHYDLGWHATSTVGVFSAAAAAAIMTGLDAGRLPQAFGLAAAMAGGLQLNFSTMAKPAHAGFAASAGVRAVRLAAAGITASDDIFAKGGVGTLYSAQNDEVGDDAFTLRPARVSVKLFPSCYATSRLIGAALDIRRDLGPMFGRSDVTVRLTTPAGSLRVLRYDRPTDSLQAKFSATFPVAAALLDGPPLLEHFTDDGVARADIRDMMDRLTVVEDSGRPYDGNLESGHVTIEAFAGGERIALRDRWLIPGTEADPVSREQIAAKAAGCFAVYRRAYGADFPLLAQLRAIPEVATWLD